MSRVRHRAGTRTKTRRWTAALAVLLAAAPAGAAQGQSSAAHAASEADAAFIRGMIAHHQQALEMAALVPERTMRDDLRMMAERIDVSQRSEIERMEQWLRARGLSASADSAHHGHHGAHGPGHEAGAHGEMPGMATPAEMAELAAARGAEFDRRLLELMIRHHEGALVMVHALFASPDGGQDSEIYHIASEVDADQRMEIDRMRAMLQGPAGAPRPR